MKKLVKFLIFIFVGLLFFIFLFLVFVSSQRSSAKIEAVGRGTLNGALTLDQNWTPSLRDKMNHISFGSRLLPYSWFLHLELPESQSLFREDQHLEKLGFIPAQASLHNPDALAIGLAIDQQQEGQADEPWLGLTCAACHSAELRYQGQRIYIDGAPAKIDFQAFENTLLRSLSALLEDEEKFQRFVKGTAVSDANNLRLAVQARETFLTARASMNKTAVAYGHGRLDAFGQIFNAVSVEALGIEGNARSPNAPVDFPVLWDASHLDVVQWNGSASNVEPGPLGQNVTTALAVYGSIELQNQSGLGYDSSVRLATLGEIQSNYYLLTSPQWPQDILGEINPEKAARGEAIYRANCLSCHTLVDNSDAYRKIKTTLVPQSQVGTDPLMASNFVEAESQTGILEGRKMLAGLAGEKFSETARSFDIVVHAASGVMAKKPVTTLLAVLKEWQDQYPTASGPLAKNYKARPLNGLWASAPYLHNGSVPTLFHLLSSPQDRPQVFYIGNLDFDPRYFGLQLSELRAQSVSEFDTRLPGNSNTGHEFGVHLSDADKWDLIEYIKTL